MADDPDQKDPIDHLVDLFVYAPIGLLYEYDEVMERLVKRGKSQVQIARVIGQLAVSGRRAAGDANDLADVASTAVARVVTDLGSLFGLAPPQQEAASPPPPREPPPPTDRPAPPPVDPPALPEAVEAPSLPIANYDDLKAKEIIPLLDELSADQRAVIRARELDGRSRKTVLAKLDRLDD